MVELARFVRSQLDVVSQTELRVVDLLAEQLRKHLEDHADDLVAAHVHGASSLAIQTLVGKLLEDELQFEQEVVFAASEGISVRPRPDFVYRLTSDRGIIAEVERGGTTTNLKDMWKAHLAPDAHHLFLIVPMNNWRRDGSPREKVFPTVKRRIGAFFGDPRREVDVVSAHIFGY